MKLSFALERVAPNQIMYSIRETAKKIENGERGIGVTEAPGTPTYLAFRQFTDNIAGNRLGCNPVEPL